MNTNIARNGSLRGNISEETTLNSISKTKRLKTISGVVSSSVSMYLL